MMIIIMITMIIKNDEKKINNNNKKFQLNLILYSLTDKRLIKYAILQTGKRISKTNMYYLTSTYVIYHKGYLLFS